MKGIVKIEIKVPVKITEKDNVFVSHCPVLDVASQRNTAQEARENFVEAVTAFLLTCFDMGTLAEVLKSCGSEHVEPSTVSHFPATDDADLIDIPLPFIIDNSSAECHA